MKYKPFGRLPADRQIWVFRTVALLVALTGLITISSTLTALIHLRLSRLVDADAHLTLLAGLSLIYLATLLRRGKQMAWTVAVPIFIFLVLRNARHFTIDLSGHEDYDIAYFLNLFLPVAVLAVLLLEKRFFTVRSEVRSFTTAFKRSAIILLVAFLYGAIGFQLLDKPDFRQEISLQTGMHYTIDQFGLTTNKQLVPYTKRAHLFLASLGAISLGALFYVGVSLFSPIRFRLTSHQQDLEDIKALLQKYPGNSEDFFKLWPRDKAYFFDYDRNAAVAYRASQGIAMAVGDPAGDPSFFDSTLTHFIEFCRINDWQPAFIHALKGNLELYKKHGLEAQKIGEEAIVDIRHFNTSTSVNKYFRHIANKFTKQGYRCEMLEPPHNVNALNRLKEISDDWLEVPGRSERGFMMGYFSDNYLQQCPIMVVHDVDSTIRAFINLLPDLGGNEANYDLLRHGRGSLGNINDYLMLNFIKYLAERGYQKLNMGLCPFSGLSAEESQKRGVVSGLLDLIYTNSSRFYSFQGLRRFKDKYEPQWRDRYIIYSGGVVGLTKTANALIRAMRLPKH